MTILQTISEKVNISPALEQQLMSCFKLTNAQKGDIILKEGQRARWLYFVEKGVLHNYYYSKEKQVSSWFYTEGQFITAWSSFYTQTESFEYIECLEDCTLYAISYTDYQQLIADYPAFCDYARQLTESMLVMIEQISKNWSFYTAQEKYEMLQTYFPQIELRVKLGLIASFLGISQETLSRIRAKR